MPTSEEKQNDAKAPGKGTTLIMVALLSLGSLVFSIMVPSWSAKGLASWPAGALAGFLLSGAMGLWSLWSTRRAFHRKGQGAFVRAVFGNMLLRLLITGLLVGLVLGFGWLHAFGFVGGMFGGLLVFQIIEISAVANAASPEDGPAEGATNHAR